MITITTASSLGSRCWSAARFTKGCQACERYDRCTYPERIPNEKYDALRKEAARLKKLSEETYRQAKDMT